ncbi:phosphatase PAP2 family protein [Cupriavidus basilensis]|uniref:Phosphatase PAP2 family protein n=1 Tax=Cupriavidus basilensis TaxID=68895 RepID=A0ABT6ALJ4_9BURK|nr:phosphatase PAP2 family protein [Cupriavidus basilensis]MDF3833480.1 phosphatase PAP2 family protein [Cupriavidus basilensis]
MMLWEYVIPFGDSTWTLPLAASIAIVSLLGGYRARALHWLACFGIGLTVIIAGKLAFDLGGWCLPAAGFYSISGHAMQTTAIYPLLFMVIGAVFGERAVRWGFYLGLAAALLMAVTLVAGNYHTLSETVVGMMVGMLVVCSYMRWQPSLRPVHLSLLVVLPLSVALIFDMHDTVNPTKAALWQRAAHWMGATEQYTRQIYTDPVSGMRRISVRLRQIL